MWFYTQAAFVTFGGAYAVLSYIADVAVNGYGWLTGSEMVRGLGLAESTPGPLIMVTEYVGFVAAWKSHRRTCRASCTRLPVPVAYRALSRMSTTLAGS